MPKVCPPKKVCSQPKLDVVAILRVGPTVAQLDGFPGARVNILYL